MDDVVDIVAEKKNLLAFDDKTLDNVGADKVMSTKNSLYFASVLKRCSLPDFKGMTNIPGTFPFKVENCVIGII